MKGYKLFAVIIITICINAGLNAMTKVINRYNRRVPEWISVSQKEYLVTSGKALTLSEARNIAYDSLENLVVNFVINQMKTQNSYFKQIDFENERARKLFKESDFYADFNAKNPFTFYWERLKNKETKSKFYNYYLHYSLDDEELDKAINDIAEEYQISSTLESIKKNFSGCKKVQDLHEMNSSLMFINAKFSDDDARKEDCEILLAKAKENFDNIDIKEMLNIPGKLIVNQTVNDRAIYNSTPPKVTSKDVKITKIESLEEQWIINYEFNPYLIHQSKVINVEFDNIENKRSKDFKLDLNKEPMEIKLSGAPIVIARNKMIKLHIISTYRGDVVLEKVVLRFNDSQFTETRLNQLLDGAALYTIRYMAPPGFFRIKPGDRVSGELHYISRKTGQKEIFHFYNQTLALQPN